MIVCSSVVGKTCMCGSIYYNCGCVVNGIVAEGITSMQFFLCAVVIWSDLLGGVHLWQSTLFWNSSLNSNERTALWPQTGQTKQYRLFR